MRESEDHPIGDNDKVKTSRGYDTEMEDFVITENVWDGIGPFEGKNDGAEDLEEAAQHKEDDSDRTESIDHGWQHGQDQKTDSDVNGRRQPIGGLNPE